MTLYRVFTRRKRADRRQHDQVIWMAVAVWLGWRREDPQTTNTVVEALLSRQGQTLAVVDKEPPRYLVRAQDAVHSASVMAQPEEEPREKRARRPVEVARLLNPPRTKLRVGICWVFARKGRTEDE